MRARRGWILLTVLSLTSCVLVNSFEDLKDPPLDAGGGTDGEIGEAGGPDGGTGLPPLVEAGSPDGGLVDKGAIVIGGAIESDAGANLVLTALDPSTGAELPGAREPMKVAALFYDATRDLWLVFESGGASFIPAPADPVTLHVRTLDPSTGVWTERSRLQVPSVVSFASVALVRERVGYVAYRPGGGAPQAYDFVSINLSNPDATSVLDTAPLAKLPVGAIGTRSETGVGGVINFLQRGACDGGACVEVNRVLLSPAGPVQMNTLVPNAGTAPFVPYGGGPTFGSFLGQGFDMIGSRSGSTAPAVVYFFQPLNNLVAGTPVSFDVAGSALRPLAFSECLETLLAVETNTDLLVHAVPVAAGGARATIGMNHAGQGVYFEPYTKTVLTPFSQGPGFELTAFTLGGTKSAPTLKKRSAPEWSPPARLRPQLVATRSPASRPCD